MGISIGGKDEASQRSEPGGNHRFRDGGNFRFDCTMAVVPILDSKETLSTEVVALEVCEFDYFQTSCWLIIETGSIILERRPWDSQEAHRKDPSTPSGKAVELIAYSKDVCAKCRDTKPLRRKGFINRVAQCAHCFQFLTSIECVGFCRGGWIPYDEKRRSPVHETHWCERAKC